MDLYEVESKIKELEASYNKEADNLMQELNAYKKKNPILPMYGDDPNVDKMIANKIESSAVSTLVAKTKSTNCGKSSTMMSRTLSQQNIIFPQM